MGRGEQLQKALSTVFSEFEVRAQSAATASEERLMALEDRDNRREQRSAERRAEMEQKYDALGG